jgi:hypothetical protein
MMEDGGVKIPRSKSQAGKKSENPNKTARSFLFFSPFGDWIFLGIWSLGFGISRSCVSAVLK